MTTKQFKTFQKLNRRIWGKEKFIENGQWELLFNTRLTPVEQQKYKELHNLYNLYLDKIRKSSFKPF